MKAWMISEIDNYDGENKSCIIFNNFNFVACRLGADELNLDRDQVTYDRKPEYDQYSDKGHVPVEVLIADGWWFECFNCSKKVTIETESPVYINDGIYCSTECRQDRIDKIAKVNINFEAFKLKVLNLKGNYEGLIFEGGWPCLSPSAKFTFPGAKHGGGKLIEYEGVITGTVANGDLEAYNEHFFKGEENAEDKV